MTDEQGRRVLFFGNYAGHAGLVDSLWAYGQRMKLLGVRTPFLKLRQAINYSNLTELKEDVKQIGKEIETKGLPAETGPFICGFFGYGHVSQGLRRYMIYCRLLRCQPQNWPRPWRRDIILFIGFIKLFSKKRIWLDQRAIIL